MNKCIKAALSLTATGKKKNAMKKKKTTLRSFMKNKVILSRMQVIEAQSVFHQNNWMSMFRSKYEIIDFSITFWVPTCQAFNQD